MKKHKLKIVLCSIGIIFSSLLMIVSTYAYFSVNVEGEGKDITISTFDQNTTIIYNDTSNVSMVNAYTGDEIVKTFSVENTSDNNLYYDIVLKNVVNNFINKNELVYTLTSNTTINRSQSIIPSDDEAIASQVLIKPHETHKYKMTITFLQKDKDQSENMNKTFSSNIAIEGSKNININESIYKDNTLLKYLITNAKSEEADENGIYITNSSTNGISIYYYKGDKNINNNLIFNNMCFKIIRTDENYGIRVMYYGDYIDNQCIYNKELTTSFNTKSNYNAYVGFMYGNASSNSYKNEHNNTNSSNIKKILDEWYKENLSNNNKVSNQSIFCNNRSMNEFKLKGVLYSKNGYGASNTGYYNIDDTIISYECPNIEDRFSVLNEISNKKLEYPVGLITVDEILFSGKNSYLYSLGSYYTMTPAYFNGSDAYIYVVDNGIKTSKATKEYLVRPVISLNKDIILDSGDGTLENPFVVK